jgi:hypothetical protein
MKQFTHRRKNDSTRSSSQQRKSRTAALPTSGSSTTTGRAALVDSQQERIIHDIEIFEESDIRFESFVEDIDVLRTQSNSVSYLLWDLKEKEKKRMKNN